MAYDIGTARGVIELEYNGRGTQQAEEGLDRINAKGQDVDRTLGKLGSGMMVAGTAIAGGLALGVNAAANFEERMSAVNAVSGATASQLDALKDKALQLGKDTSFSATEAASAIEELVKAGLPVEDVLNGAADATVALAAAGEVALPEAATIASNAMNQFNLAAKDLPNVADKIAGAANASAIDVGDFGQSLQQVGAVANLVGADFDDVATAIALMGNAGIKGSDAGTSLKSMFSRLQPTTKQQRDEMTRLGLLTFDTAKAMKALRDNGVKPLSSDTDDLNGQLNQLAADLSGAKVGSAKAASEQQKLMLQTGATSNAFYDQEGNLKSLSDVSGTLEKSLKGMNAQQKQAALQVLFGSDAIRAAAILSNNGAKGFDKMAGSIAKIKAADVAKKRLDNLKGSIEQMKGSLETAGITAGEIFLPMIRDMVDGIANALNWFLNLTDGQKKFIVVSLAVVSAVLLIGGAIIKTILLMKQLTVAITVLKAATIPWTGVMTAALGVIALTGAAVAIFASKSNNASVNIDKAKERTEEWTEALQGLDDISSSMARDKALEKLGTISGGEFITPAYLKLLKGIGINQRDLVNGLLNEAGARGRLQKIADKGLKSQDDATLRGAAALDLFLQFTNAESAALNGVIQKNKEHNRTIATLEDRLKALKQQTGLNLDIKNLKGKATIQDVKDLAKQYKLTGGQIRTVLEALQIPATVKDVRNLGKALGDVGKQKTKPKIDMENIRAAKSALEAILSLFRQIAGTPVPTPKAPKGGKPKTPKTPPAKPNPNARTGPSRGTSRRLTSMASSGISTAPSPVAAAPARAAADAASGGLRLLDGELRLDESGRAFISGVAYDAIDDSDDFDSFLGRMG